MMLNSTGLGIGTTSPNQLLTLNVPVSNTVLNCQRAGVDQGSIGVDNSGMYFSSGATNQALRFYRNAANTETMRISQYGDVGIGCIPGYKLDVNGTFNCNNNATLSAASYSTKFAGYTQHVQSTYSGGSGGAVSLTKGTDYTTDWIWLSGNLTSISTIGGATTGDVLIISNRTSGANAVTLSFLNVSGSLPYNESYQVMFTGVGWMQIL
jgi:hypothetical protein